MVLVFMVVMSLWSRLVVMRLVCWWWTSLSRTVEAWRALYHCERVVS